MSRGQRCWSDRDMSDEGLDRAVGDETLTEGDASELRLFRDFLQDPDPDRRAAYLRHYGEVAP